MCISFISRMPNLVANGMESVIVLIMAYPSLLLYFFFLSVFLVFGIFILLFCRFIYLPKRESPFIYSHSCNTSYESMDGDPSSPYFY